MNGGTTVLQLERGKREGERGERAARDARVFRYIKLLHPARYHIDHIDLCSFEAYKLHIDVLI